MCHIAGLSMENVDDTRAAFRLPLALLSVATARELSVGKDRTYQTVVERHIDCVVVALQCTR